MVTLDDAIKHADEMAQKAPGMPCAGQHKQIGAWLRELRDHREASKPLGWKGFLALFLILALFVGAFFGVAEVFLPDNAECQTLCRGLGAESGYIEDPGGCICTIRIEAVELGP